MPRKKSKLSVHPLRKVYQPKYPSYFDDNPLKYPNAYPYPFSKKMLQALSTTGFTGVLLLSALSGCDTPKNVSSSTNSSSNPFPVAAANLPYRPIMFGTGLPTRLETEDAIDFINQAFQKEGLEMKYDTVIEVNGIRVPANAYNEQYQLGYVWIDYLNHGEGMAKHYETHLSTKLSQPKVVKHYRQQIDYYWQQYQEDAAAFISRHIYHDSKETEDFRDVLENKLPAIEDITKRKKSFKEAYIHYYIYSQSQFHDENPTPAVQVMIQISDRVKDPLEVIALMYRFGASINRYNRSHRVGEAFTAAFTNELEQIRDIKNVKKWRNRLEGLIELLSDIQHYHFIQEGHPILEELGHVLANEDWQKRKKHTNKLYKMIDEHLVDYNEVKKMEALAEKGKAFIAPISSRDDRTIIHRDGRSYIPELVEQQRELHRQIRAATSDAQKDSLNLLLEQVNKKERELAQIQSDSMHLATLQRLENDVRQYIQWAKAQQGY